MAEFNVAAGRLKGSYDAVLISTDLEPDDAICLAVLAPMLKGVPLLCVVGEGPNDKRTMMAELLATFGIDEGAQIVQGKTSKAGFPAGVEHAYSDATRAHRCELLEGGEAAVPQLVEGFLTKHARPFALLLKPPHELLSSPEALLAKTKAAIYGSFNLQELRKAMGEAAGGKLSEEELFERQFALMSRFAALLWIERSCSCGRDCVLEPAVCPPAVWGAIDASAPLSRHIQLWNAETVREMGKKIAKLPSEIDTALGAADGPAADAITAASYSKLQPTVEKLDKRVKVLLSISSCAGRQVCHADTLVAAALVDDGSLTKFERPIKLEIDAKLKPTMAADPASTVVAYVADAGPEREALIKASFEAIARGLSATKAA